MYILLFLLWVILNGKFNLEIATFGLVISAAVYWFACKFMNYSFKREFELIKTVPKIVKYLIILMIEVIKANLATAKVILNFEEEPEPVLATFNMNLESNTAQVVLANTITLTPGTITCELNNGEFMVHALDEGFAVGLDSSDFVKRLEVMEAEHKSAIDDAMKQRNDKEERKEKENV